jgi:glycosyltransferase involved in cell wall biosynthesis
MRASISDLCVIGHPSRVGGADTELDHQMRCWQAMGIKVHVCHTGVIDDHLKSLRLEDCGVIYHPSRDWKSLEGLDCISFCNGEFLANLPEIRKYARSITWVNCMTWNFDREVQMHSERMIDLHLYQTEHALERVGAKLRALGNFQGIVFTPYFHAEDFPFHTSRPIDKFRFGRISRADADKFNHRQLWIYETMTAPVLKEGLILGWNDRIATKVGKQPDSYIRAVPEGTVSQREFYATCEAIIMTTDTFENLPRVGFEAMSSGSVLVVDRRGGWQLQVDDGITGWLCADDREFVYKASRCAFESEERERMRHAARAKLEQTWGLEAAVRSWEQVFAHLAGMKRIAA